MSTVERWRVEVAPAAAGSLSRLPSKVAAAIAEFVTVTLPASPAAAGRLLGYELAGLRSARRGDYRVLFALDEAAHLLLVVRIAHRADLYR